MRFNRTLIYGGCLLLWNLGFAADESAVGTGFRGKIGFSTQDSVADWPRLSKAPQGAPNIVLILLDDVGFAAASTFGGPAQTPELERLAKEGLRYNRFHVSALCSSTRATLLSGRNDHRVGFGTVAESARGFPGYDSVWRKNAASVAEILRRSGYSTAAFGKWHDTPVWEVSPVGPFDRWPTGFGFEYFYGIMAWGDSQWEPLLYRNTVPVEPPATPQQGYHFTQDTTDEAIHWVHDHEALAPEKPYFLYFATSATHAPLHVPQEWIAKYRGQFDEGWDKLRSRIFTRQKELGFVPANAELTAAPDGLPKWDDYSVDEKKVLAREMEVYAAFLGQTDYEVGRLLKVIQSGPQADNTLILYIVGDNGADPGDSSPPGDPSFKARLSHLDFIGSEQFLNEYGSGWGWALSTPFKGTKGIASHFGGTRDPLIVSWPARIKDLGGLRTQFTHANDVAATIYDVAGIKFPNEVDGVKQLSLDGTSFAYTFSDSTAPSRHTVQIFEQMGNRALYKDGWVVAARHVPDPTGREPSAGFKSDPWELYNVDNDFSEAHDLSKVDPLKLHEMQMLFDTEAKRNNIYPLDDAFLTKLPIAGATRDQFHFFSDMTRTPSDVGPDFSRSHLITADVVIPDKGGEGVIIADGGRFGGFSLYIKDRRLIYEVDRGQGRYEALVSDELLPTGPSTLVYRFSRSTSAGDPGKGTGALYMNGKLVAKKSLDRMGRIWLGVLSVGQKLGSSGSPSYVGPFKFTGTLQKVDVELE